MVTIDSQIPAHFFPTAASGLKTFLWQCQADQQSTLYEALSDYLASFIHTQAERELADIIVEDLITDWHVYLAVDHIAKAHHENHM